MLHAETEMLGQVIRPVAIIAPVAAAHHEEVIARAAEGHEGDKPAHVA